MVVDSMFGHLGVLEIKKRLDKDELDEATKQEIKKYGGSIADYMRALHLAYVKRLEQQVFTLQEIIK